jgi:hypothetical protein
VRCLVYVFDCLLASLCLGWVHFGLLACYHCYLNTCHLHCLAAA